MWITTTGSVTQHSKQVLTDSALPDLKAGWMAIISGEIVEIASSTATAIILEEPWPFQSGEAKIKIIPTSTPMTEATRALNDTGVFAQQTFASLNDLVTKTGTIIVKDAANQEHEVATWKQLQSDVEGKKAEMDESLAKSLEFLNWIVLDDPVYIEAAQRVGAYDDPSVIFKNQDTVHPLRQWYAEGYEGAKDNPNAYAGASSDSEALSYVREGNPCFLNLLPYNRLNPAGTYATNGLIIKRIRSWNLIHYLVIAACGGVPDFARISFVDIHNSHMGAVDPYYIKNQYDNPRLLARNVSVHLRIHNIGSYMTYNAIPLNRSMANSTRFRIVNNGWIPMHLFAYGIAFGPKYQEN